MFDDAIADRQRARQWAWLDRRAAEIAAEYLAELPADLRASRVVREAVEHDAARGAMDEFLARFKDDPAFGPAVLSD